MLYLNHSLRRVFKGQSGAAIRAAVESLENRNLFASIIVTTTAAGNAVDGQVSLNEAIASANSNAAVNADVVASGTYGADTINFNIPGSGQLTIVDATLPTITDQLTIDGYTQTGSSLNTATNGTNAVLNVRLSGSPLNVQAAGSTISGLVLTDVSAGAALTISANNVTVAGNVIGTADGTNTAGNQVGISVADDVTGTSIGSLAFADRNLISGNSVGIAIAGDSSTVEGNLIGVNAAGDAALLGTLPAATVNAGVYIIGGNNNTIGGDLAGQGNIIAFNAGDGVATTATATDNVITRNSIHSNVEQGIDLGSDGVTANDVGDTDAVQNFPVITSAQRLSATQLSVQLQLSSRASSAFVIDFYSSTTADGEGQTYLGSTTINTDATGAYSNTVLLAVDVAVGAFLTATARGTDGTTTTGTSEFSAALAVTAPVVAAPGLSVNDVTLTEGDSGTKDFVFTVTRSGTDLSGVTTVDYMTGDGTATIAGNDYTDTAGTLTFNAGETSKTITVPVIGDTAVEGDEVFAVMLSNISGATLTDSSGVGTITNDDVAPPVLPRSLSVNDVTVKEGDTDTCIATFTVTRTGDTSVSTTVDYATANGTAVAGGDYTAKSGTLTFAAGETTKTVDIAVKTDGVTETDEQFSLVLSDATNATIADGTGVATIKNDDFGESLLTINNVRRAEGDSGTTAFTFTVTRSGDTSAKTLVYYTTGNGYAKAGSDYVPQDGSLTFLPGETSKTITVQVNGDNTVEADEYFRVRIGGATNATIADNQGLGMIIDDDKTAASSFLRIGVVKKLEGNSGLTNFTFTVTRSGSATSAASVAYQTLNGTAKAGSDYLAQSGTVNFAKGERTKTVTIKVIGDTKVETNETFKVELSNATNAAIASSLGYGRILNDDDPGIAPEIRINNIQRNEGDSGLTRFTFDVHLNRPSLKPVTFNYRTIDESALGTCGCDFRYASGKVTIAAGDIWAPITIYVKGETTAEPDEVFRVKLTNAVNATFNDSVGIATILNDD